MADGSQPELVEEFMLASADLVEATAASEDERPGVFSGR
jgi:hypothetical protein